ncbi:extracellular solute-binding protein [Paenibacillus sp. LHD-38]|uniref:ABC transporter substrate-binding protein n=1 Tax=Paenibacillus sp. LHD-38 TaxID=3072143 RepID=UPI00280E4476|nr:extracellular solute-binding protein [Paenibacillus sp. LHD-38]MDQ8734692.1 extracellular solute-binding protein [Paenibacillus sp. LHD-38]
MKNKRTFTFVISILLIFMLVLAACSLQEWKGGHAAKGTESSKADLALSRAPVKLKLLTWADDTYQELYDMFHAKYPWITIEPIRIDGGDDTIMNKIIALEAAGTPADLTWVVGDLLRYEENGLLENLKPYMDRDVSFQSKLLPDGYFDTMAFNGRRLAVPFVDVPMWIVVNKDLLAKHGVEMPPNDWTFEDFREIAKQVTDSAAGEYGLTTSSDFVMRLLPMKAAADGNAPNLAYLDEKLRQSLLSTPAVMDDVRWLSEFVTKDGSMLSWEESADKGDVVRQFTNGKTAFEIGGDWLLPRLQKEAPFDWDILPFPRGKVNQYSFHINGPLALLSGSKHKEEAYKWISFQFEMEAQKWKVEKGANASVIDPELTAYIDQVPLWQGKNIEAVKMTKDNALVLPGATIPGFSEYNWINVINDIVFQGHGIHLIIPQTEAWNQKTLELREQWKRKP